MVKREEMSSSQEKNEPIGDFPEMNRQSSGESVVFAFSQASVNSFDGMKSTPPLSQMDTLNTPPSSQKMEALVNASDLLLGNSQENVGSQPQLFGVGSHVYIPSGRYPIFVENEDILNLDGQRMSQSPMSGDTVAYSVMGAYECAVEGMRYYSRMEQTLEFSVLPMPHPPTKSNPTYLFSPAPINKLFIMPTSVTKLDKAVPCGFQVRTNWNPSADTVIRAKLVWCHAGMTTPLQRCHQHRDEEVEWEQKYHSVKKRAAATTASHVLRPPPREGYEKYLDVNKNTEERSVVMPFTPETADKPLYYIFTCTNSCKPESKKQLSLVFTLEQDGNVLDTSSMGIRICANPSRDSKAKPPQPPAVKPEIPGDQPAGDSGFVNLTNNEDDVDYVIRTKNPKFHAVLKGMLDTLEETEQNSCKCEKGKSNSDFSVTQRPTQGLQKESEDAGATAYRRKKPAGSGTPRNRPSVEQNRSAPNPQRSRRSHHVSLSDQTDKVDIEEYSDDEDAFKSA